MIDESILLDWLRVVKKMAKGRVDNELQKLASTNQMDGRRCAYYTGVYGLALELEEKITDMEQENQK